MGRPVDYDAVAPTYDRRFAYYAETTGTAGSLLALAADVQARHVLEVGCGTGHWLKTLGASGVHACGVDASLGMLRQGRASGDALFVVAGRANALPFGRETFDVVFCANAIHHFEDWRRFIAAARDLLRPGGALAVIGMNPHAGRDRWFLYDHFPGTYETDLRRYPSSGSIVDAMIGAGFESVGWHVAERLCGRRVGREMLAEPMLDKRSTSQLTLLTDPDYSAGIERIRAAVAEAESAGEEAVFSVDISLSMVTGRVAGGRASPSPR
jgi:ubiquinone/menaquinone biosynthesis C-methylase UbiE